VFSLDVDAQINTWLRGQRYEKEEDTYEEEDTSVLRLTRGYAVRDMRRRRIHMRRRRIHVCSD
jgi:hypothetical protein